MNTSPLSEWLRSTPRLTPVAMALAMFWSAGVRASTFTVTTTADSGAVGSLRWAITSANANPGPDIIQFNIPGGGIQTIFVGAALPPITDPVTIDGYSQPGASVNTQAASDNANLLIELDGGGVSFNSLNVNSSSCVVKGLIIRGFFIGIELAGGGGHQINGNFIGIAPGGTAARNVGGFESVIQSLM